MKNIDAANHTRGLSEYVDDVPMRVGCLHAVPFGSPAATGKITRLDLDRARASEGVLCVLTAADIRGENEIGNILPDEPLLAEGEVHYCGQPIALVVATSVKEAMAARAEIRVELEGGAAPVLDPRDAASREELIVPPRVFRLGDPGAQWSTCAHVFEGRAEVGGQEHLYLETQAAFAHPAEGGAIHVTSSTQGPTVVQKAAARVLGVPMHKVVVDVTRLGGGFGGKEDQATAWAVMVAFAAQHTGRAVKLVLHRLDDMRMTGKRHPYSADYRIGLDEDLRIVAFEADFYQNAGAACDLSPAVLERTLFHATNSYFIPHVRATGYCCRTNLPPNTAFRGFGGPQGMFVIESAIAAAAEGLGVAAHAIQERNLLRDGDTFPYGQVAAGCQARSSFERCAERFDLPGVERDVQAFNASHPGRKRGLALMPVTFGISFTKTHMNQARALVHVYQDGSVGVSTGAVEMGQGVNTKLLQVAARVFSLAPDRIKLETTNTTRIANTSPTAASAGSDLNGKALELACERVRERLLDLARTRLAAPPEASVALAEGGVQVEGAPTDWTWDRLVLEAFVDRVSLSEHAHYATPGIHFDATVEKGHPFAYHVHGTALVVAEVDCLRGTYGIESVRIVHDFGKSMNTSVDRGQVEGGLVQGLGWMTMEELVHDDAGRLRSDALSTYKVPDVYAAPRVVEVEDLGSPPHDLALFGSKAVGEPPLMYGLGGYFAIRAAVRAFQPGTPLPFDAPITPEKVLRGLYPAECGA